MKKKKKTIIFMTFLIIIILIFTIFTIRYFTYKKNIDDIKIIEVSTNLGYMYPTNNYIIDFDKNLITYNYKYHHKENNDNQTLNRNFTEKDARYFIKKANLYGFFSWKDTYRKNFGADGPHTYICITFKDDTVQKINCWADFPFTYNKIGEVLYEAFGYDIFLIFTY